MRYQRFVAVGDSCTEGLDDPYPGGERYRGWADLVAVRLARDEPELRYANLGVRGRRLDQITVEQMPIVAELKPDLIALFGGGNDVLARGWDARTVERRVDKAIRASTEIAPKIVVFTLSDISRQLPLGWRMRPRLVALNNAIREAAVNYGALLVDLWFDEAAPDSRYFGPDRLHLSEPGHRRLAAHLLTALGVSFDRSWLTPLPGRPVRPGLRADARWFYREVLPVAYTRARNRVVGRSPGDGLFPKRPELLPVRLDDVNAWAHGNA
jgi:lysophospholipase L1-like esterase